MIIKLVLRLIPILSVVMGAGCQQSSPVQVGGGGLGGTGISVGVITAFGSIFVNGVEFNVSGALNGNRVLLNGKPVATQNAMTLGMVVAVTGTLDSHHHTGTADKVEYNDELLGPVAAIDATAGTFQVLNTTVAADARTIFSGDPGFSFDPANNIAVLAGLAQGGAVFIEVSGLWDASNVLHATAIIVKNGYSGPSAIRGKVEGLDAGGAGTFTLRGVVVDYGGANLGVELANGANVEVYGAMDSTTKVLNASRVVPDAAAIAPKMRSLNGERLSMEGLVDALDTTAKTFSVDGVTVNYSGAKIESLAGSPFDLQQGGRVEVKGTVQGGVLIATHMEGDESAAPAGSGAAPVNIDTTPVQSTDIGTHMLVLALDPADPNAILKVKLTPLTVFEDERNLGLPLNYDTAFGTTAAAIQQGSRVEVSGSRDPSSGIVTATRIEVKY